MFWYIKKSFFICEKKLFFFHYIGNALVDTALLPTLAYLVDVRHTSVYGYVGEFVFFWK